jgi:exopolyphosphatase/guanosine-5'-triphosphate,3'-diphosphate pyrophosphatase
VPGSTADAVNRLPAVRVAVIDVGSNSVRLLVAAVESSGEVRRLERERAYLRLGDDAFRLGRIGRRKLDALAETAELYARRARAARVERVETFVTAPGRQASNADELVERVADATAAPVVVLRAEDEGRLAWEGAVASLSHVPGRVAVVDLGGGSCEVAVGTRQTGPTWVQSRDAGALRVTRAFLPSSRPSKQDLAAAREGVAELLGGLDPPAADEAFAVGGTARAVAKLIGPRFGAGGLDRLATQIIREGAAATTAGLDVSEERISTLLGGTLVLAYVARRLDAKLEVARGGLREGAALALARATSIAA